MKKSDFVIPDRKIAKKIRAAVKKAKIKKGQRYNIFVKVEIPIKEASSFGVFS